MKKVRKFPFERIPAFLMYALTAYQVYNTFTVGRGCLFWAVILYLVGMSLDPKSEIHEDK